LPKAFLIKFRESTPNPYFEGRVFTNPQKSQPSSKYPHWEICEPGIRKRLGRGSILFFAPSGSWNVKFVMVVSWKMDSARAKKKLGRRWARIYQTQACAHPGVSRYGDVIIGSPSKSVPLGEGVDVSGLIPPKFHGRKHNNLREFRDFEEARRLYEWLREQEPKVDSPLTDGQEPSS
jgi:hypothetical protein